MAIVISCASCGTTPDVQDFTAGAPGRCCACGAEVQPTVKPRKTCCACGLDVSHLPRTKDGHGRYFCNPCSTTQQGAERDADGAASDDCLACAQCGSAVETQDLDVSGVCTLCALQQAAAPASKRIARSRPSFWSSDANIVAATLIPLLLIGGAIGGWLLWSSHSERGARSEIAHLKRIADQRLAAVERKCRFQAVCRTAGIRRGRTN